ncbi:aminotransferase class I/II-fold pyridoxal phosphate-dependent enzyme [Macrococcus equipercicus]|uniref:Aminotransferase class V-fold PLP-dependent enzyme n=1 Tax=Macrococcus equipercicus TaxID=69967 RepID=A0A9Q9BQ70_9STAP|nr:aminotransferase class I/II-fold pyridoxal phosphate-dependent enzyme [Macrococcus equipercicus]KAA1037730.1 aminotransferase class V-fold PLP-dependent enzyme [Macrococcus equipercicus]UTH13444.1 aminotransferase class V-fold PLP-dependent enzyme [Macrococcus equipercicus]
MIKRSEIKPLTAIDSTKHHATPLFDALKLYEAQNVTSFDVPGHKRGLDEQSELYYYGRSTLRHDVNSMPQLDNYDNPKGVIKEAQNLLADLYLADEAHFLVNGTTEGIQTMILAVCRPGDKLILPRNVHKSVLNAMALADVTPVYVSPEFDVKFGIAHNLSYDNVKAAIDKHPDARAIFIMNPTYFGAVSDLQAITELAHAHGMPVLVDEAHGAHFRFSPHLPISSMEAGADMAATSLHKTGGSFTQSSALLVQGDLVDKRKVKSVINMLTSTSASYLLMSSLDIARKNLALNGPEKFEQLMISLQKFKQAVNDIPGFHMLDGKAFKDLYHQQLDESKLTIYIDSTIELSGFEVYKLLRSDYSIQMELAEPNLIMGIVSIADNEAVLERLLEALQSISRLHHQAEREVHSPVLKQLSIPEQAMGLREVLYADKYPVNIEDAVGEICAESLMIYPPGIPIVMAGERISQDIVDYWQFINNQPIIKIGTENSNQVYIIEKRGK